MKTMKHISLLIVLLFLFAACATPLSTAKPTPAATETHLSEETYSRSSDYERPFKAWYGKTAQAEIYIYRELYSAAQATALFKKLQGQLEAANKRLALPKSITVFVVDSTWVDGPYTQGESLVIPRWAADSGQYLNQMAAACYSCGEPWLQAGLAQALWGSPLDTPMLKAYYETAFKEAGAKNILSLTPWLFLSTYNTPKELAILSATATSLVEYIEKTYKAEKLLALCNNPEKLPELLGVSTKQLKNDWLKSLGCKQGYDYPYEDTFTGLTCLEANGFLTVKGPGVQYDLAAGAFRKLPDLETFLYRNILGRAAVIRDIRNNSNDGRLFKLDADIHYTLDFSNRNSYERFSWMDAHGVSYLDSEPNAHIHEATHLYICSYRAPLAHIWLHEGLCEYFSILYGEYDREEQYEDMRDSQDAPDNTLWGLLYRYYVGKGGKTDSLEHFNLRLAYDADAYMVQKYTEAADYYYFMTDVYDAEIPDNEDLTYQEAGSFVYYLVETYSLKKVLAISNDFSTFEQVLGKSYNQVWQDWKNYLKP